jgi:hypothetical protein
MLVVGYVIGNHKTKTLKKNWFNNTWMV